MKRTLSFLLLVTVATSARTARSKIPLLTVGPQFSVQTDDDTELEIALEVVLTPHQAIGLRARVLTLWFGDNTVFAFNQGISLDALMPIPMRRIEPYAHAGFDISVFDSPAGTQTVLAARGGVALRIPVGTRNSLYLEPGIIVSDAGELRSQFRVAAGARLGVR